MGTRTLETAKFPATGGTGRREVGLSRLSLVVSHRQRPQQRKHPEPLRRAVADCLSSGHHGATSVFSSEAVRTLEDYLATSSTRDSAYSAILDHAVAERDRSPPVIPKCVAVLKKYLFRYIPQEPTLQQIDNFCAGLIAELNAVTRDQYSPVLEAALEPPLMWKMALPQSQKPAVGSASLVKSLVYIRSLVARHLPSYSFQLSRYKSSFPVLAKPLSPALNSLRSRNWYGVGGMSERAASEEQMAAKAAAITALRLTGGDCEDNEFLATNVFKWSWLGGTEQQVWAPSPIMMDSGGIARPIVQRMQNLVEQGAATLYFRGPEKGVGTWQVENGEKRQSSDFDAEQQLFRSSTITTVADASAAKSHQRAIAAAKRASGFSSGWDGEASSSTIRGPVSTLRRRPRPLFQYRYYSEQQPLRLTEVEMEEVIAAVCTEVPGPSLNAPTVGPAFASNQAGKFGMDAADVAATVLIKLLINMYMSDSRTAAPIALHVLQGMLGSPTVAVRIRAFDLVLNLGVHAHLLEPMPGEETTIGGEIGSTLRSASGKTLGGDENGVSERHLPSGVPGSATAMKASSSSGQRTPAAVGQFEAWLLDILCEMMLFLHQSEEVEETVWASALSCLLYLVCDRGQIRRDRLQSVDIRVFKVLLEVSWEKAWADEIHSLVIRLLTNMLYKLPDASKASRSSKPIFDIEQLDILGGMECICVEFARAKSAEAKNNLFSVIFDFVLYEINNMGNMVGKPVPSAEEIQAVATALSLADASECMALAFKQGLQGVGVGLARSIVTAMSRDITSNRLNGMLLEEVAGSLDMLAATSSHLEADFLELVPPTMSAGGFNAATGSLGFSSDFDFATASRAWATLYALLHSPRPSCRNNGYTWLLDLLLAEMAKGGLKHTHVLLRQLERNSPTISPAVRLLCGLLKSRSPQIRLGFVIVIEKLLLQCQKPGWDGDVSHTNTEDDLKEDATRKLGAQERALALQGLMIGALWQVISAKEKDCINILKMCNMMFSQLCVICPSPSVPSISGSLTGQLPVSGTNRIGSSTLRQEVYFSALNESEHSQGGKKGIMGGTELDGQSSGHTQGGSRSWASLLLSGHAAVPKILVGNMPTPLLYWPLIELSEASANDVTLGVAVGSGGRGSVPGGASDVRAALLLLLIGKCTAYPAALDEVGGEKFFRSLLDDSDARITYYTSEFLLKRMMTEEPDDYQRMLHNLVFKAQQSNNEKLLENPYLQLRGILQLSNENSQASQDNSDSSVQ